MIIPTVAVAAAIAMGPLAGPGASHALGTTGAETTSIATTQAGVPDKRHSGQCWPKKHSKYPCIPLAGGGYTSSPPGQLITPSGGGYVTTPPGEAIAPSGGGYGYVSTPPGQAISPSGGGYESSPPGQAIAPSGGGYVSTPPGVAIAPSG